MLKVLHLILGLFQLFSQGVNDAIQLSLLAHFVQVEKFKFGVEFLLDGFDLLVVLEGESGFLDFVVVVDFLCGLV